ncbi:hypothetical protein FH972_024490 [Carpinus fangiana]|uniref:TATA-binding protein interacting (TIP20) domain-containing protein n=1 Tax=Carpinus fangiana TaxID=176857 RepID=A0A5N6KYL6_9ROSI|nr:hypothetical protein FH972_024490 [Carpinus fangiana]
MATTINPSSVGILTAKLWDSDPDIRYMSLNDLVTAFNSVHAETLRTDYNQCAKIIEGFLKTLNDPNGEVQNLTIKCLSAFVLKCHPDILSPLIHMIAKLPDDSSVDNSISAMASRAIVVSLPRPAAVASRSQAVQNAYSSISKVLVPWLVGHAVLPDGSSKTLPPPPKGLLVNDLETGRDSNYIDVLTEVARCFGPMLEPEEIDALQKITLDILQSPRTSSVMRKKAVIALSELSRFFSDELLSSITSHLMTSLTDPHLTPQLRRLYIAILGSMARAIPSKFGPHLKTLAPFVLRAVSKEELEEQTDEVDEEEGRDPALDEVREASLITLEAFLTSCPDSMQSYYADTKDAILRFIKYDPNFSAFDEDDEPDGMNDAGSDEDDFEFDEDFEEEDAFDDEDDVSWKVRRCAAKALHTFISVRTEELLDSPEAYDEVSHALVSRFAEREESVRIEILQTLGFLIRRTAQDEIPEVVTAPIILDQSLPLQSLKRKRQRRNSDVSMMDPIKQRRVTGSVSPEAHTPPAGGSAGSLAIVGPQIVSGVLKLLKTSPLPTKQSALSVLQEFVVARQGGLTDDLKEIVGSVLDMLNMSGADAHSTLNIASGAGNASGTTLQIEALRVLGEIAKAHSSTDIQPLMSKIIPTITVTVQSKSPKVSMESLKALGQFVKVLTPPRSAASNKQSANQVEQILAAVVDVIASKSADTLVRSEAIHVLGILLGRTSSPQGGKLLSKKSRADSFELIFETSKNETTRYPSIKAIDNLAALAPQKTDFDTVWFGKICLELGAQLRKANRSLRGASLQALRTVLAEQHGSHNLDETSGVELVSMLIPLLTGKDLHMIGPSLLIFAALITDAKFAVVDEDFTKSLCELIVDPISANVIDQLADVVTSIGSAGSGQPLMAALLRDVSMKGSPAVVGKLIGDLVVSGADSVGINIDAFHKELKNSADDKRKCLALSVLGEAGLRSGTSISSSSLSPELFIGYFDVGSGDVPLAAAVALGRAAAGRGNSKTYVPAILALVNKGNTSQYLVLHAIKEILTYCEYVEELAPFQGPLWDAAVAASRIEENRIIGADCIANLAILQPRRYLQLVQALLDDSDATVRGAAILAFRDIFGGTDISFDKDLRPIIVEVLTTMMRDSDLENRRSALSTFNAATRNKASLVMPHLSQLLPLVVDQTREDPSLIREVKMGPFVHRVDDGLDCRKSAYETVYTTVETTPAAQLDPQLSTLFDRVIAGLADDHSIRALCFIMILKFSTTAPVQTQRRLDDIGDRFKAILAVTLKETAVRHEHERVEEAKRSAVRCALELARTFPGGSLPAGVAAANTGFVTPQARWTSFLDEMRSQHRKTVDEVERELKDKSQT